ncbi:MAG: murein L,D-transpeptidase catalytic domain family protein [Flavobacteriales bacterium]|nr:murein L,D-transpeptidase catalytic domain family protein [Flavobacteriales bacterium]
MLKYLVMSLLVFLMFSSISSAQSGVGVIAKSKGEEAFKFCVQNKMDTTYCIFVDLNIHSGKNRMFVWDFNSNSFLRKSLCSHGSCNGVTGPGYSYQEAVVNNVSQSYCSSIGKYKIGKRGYSNWGTNVNYKLHGLEKTNSNAYKRIIVLHSYVGVEEEEISPDYLVTSWGCPMVSNNTMYYLDKKLKRTSKPVLLWIYK